jgi:RNA polymerase sigma-70 factor (ECF subfamily)
MTFLATGGPIEHGIEMALLATTGDCATTSLCADEHVAYARRMSDRLEDSALMLRYRDGDVAAFEILYRRHKDSVFRYLLRLSQNQHTAEDVFQEAWGKIIKARRNYRPTAKFSTYLFRVAHNAFIDYVRRNKRHANDTGIDPDSRPDPGADPEQITESCLARRRLGQSLKLLPEEQRDVFLLYEEAELSIDDIAHVTGVNRETAKSRLRYAVAKLKASMAEPAPNGSR